MNIKLPDSFTVDDIKKLAGQLGCTEDLTIEFLKRALTNAILFDKKQQHYGPNNIAGWGTIGCVIRASDKFERIKNMFKKKRKSGINESIKDNMQDISNYMIIAQMCEEGVWPK